VAGPSAGLARVVLRRILMLVDDLRRHGAPQSRAPTVAHGSRRMRAFPERVGGTYSGFAVGWHTDTC
jgi:hypothetical protein